MCVKLKNKKQNNYQFIEVDSYVIPINKIQYIEKLVENYINFKPIIVYKLYFGDPTILYNVHSGVHHSYSDNGSYVSVYKFIKLTQEQYNKLYPYISEKILKS